jgi:hypothetical protein
MRPRYFYIRSRYLYTKTLLPQHTDSLTIKLKYSETIMIPRLHVHTNETGRCCFS